MGKKFKAFTLVEMLIVMGILIILMAVGIASARFAMRRASRISHQNSAERIYQALQSYYSDHREYPGRVEGGVEVSTLVTDDDYLGPYIDDFDGGSPADYVYLVDDTGQEILICVTLGGPGDTGEIGFYCTGNGVGSTNVNSDAPSERYIPYGHEEYPAELSSLFVGDFTSEWDPQTPW